MLIENNKIIEVTEDELYGVYLKRGFDDLMSFPDYLEGVKSCGTVIKEAPNEP